MSTNFIEEQLELNVVYDNLKNDESIKKIRINNELLKIDFDEIIETLFDGGNIDNPELIEKLNEILHLGMYSKAPSGGFANLFQIKGKNGNKYILFSGIDEVSNSHFIVTIHKVFRLI